MPMERVLKAVPLDLRAKMEALVHDLASALEETSGVGAGSAGSTGGGGGGIRKRWGMRRRAQSAGSLPMACGQLAELGRCSGRDSAMVASGAEDSSSSAGGGGGGRTGGRTLSAVLRPTDSDTDEDEDEDARLGIMSTTTTCGAPDDDLQPGGGGCCVTGSTSLRTSSVLAGSGLGGCLSVLAALGPAPGLLPESDSLNENFSPTPAGPHACAARRKRKFKRMAVDSTALTPVTAGPPLPVPRPPPIHKRKARMSAALRRSNCENRFGSYVLLCGKRKRSVRERSGLLHAEYDSLSHGGGHAPSSTPAAAASRFERRRTRHVLALRKLSLSDSAPVSGGGGAAAAGDMLSSSSLSSSESDAGLYTNDEGREGDDEQSDWVGGGGGWWDDYDPEDGSPDRLPSDRAFDAILSGSLPHLSEEAKAGYRAQSGREIRAGRRRLRPERPGFSVLTSANEKLSRFLQDSAQSELRLHPMQAPERAQLGHLAALYSLHMRTDGGSRPVLTKTQDTMRAVRVDQLAASGVGAAARRAHGAAAADFKRRRRIPPLQHSPTPEAATQPMDVASGVPPLAESNVGCRLLKGMGWNPGQGLGPSGAGIQEPVAATRRPRLLGLGHSYKSS